MLTLDQSSHVYRWSGRIVPGITTVLQEEGLVDYSMVPPEVMELCGDFGSAVHRAVELHDKGELNLASLDMRIHGYLAGWIMFCREFEVIVGDVIEVPMISKRWMFAGTPDRVPIVQGRRTVVELKSTSRMLPATEIQTAAQKILFEENYKEKVKRRMGVRLKPDGTYEPKFYENQSDESTWLGALQVNNWKKLHNVVKPKRTPTNG